VENASKYRRIKRQNSTRCGAQATGEGVKSPGIARSTSRKNRYQGVAAGDKVGPFYLRTLASNVHKSGGISTVERRFQARFAAVTCWIERANQVNEKARRGCCGGL
jgi:hypothetical protein